MTKACLLLLVLLPVLSAASHPPSPACRSFWSTRTVGPYTDVSSEISWQDVVGYSRLLREQFHLINKVSTLSEQFSDMLATGGTFACVANLRRELDSASQLEPDQRLIHLKGISPSLLDTLESRIVPLRLQADELAWKSESLSKEVKAKLNALACNGSPILSQRWARRLLQRSRASLEALVSRLDATQMPLHLFQLFLNERRQRLTPLTKHLLPLDLDRLPGRFVSPQVDSGFLLWMYLQEAAALNWNPAEIYPPLHALVASPLSSASGLTWVHRAQVHKGRE